MYRFSSFLLCMILLLAPDTTFTQIKYVSPSGTGTGSSWADASSDLKAILDAATYGTEIWVAEGIYYPQTCDPCQYSDRQISFQIPDGVRLYGGFAGMESHLSERDWDLHPTRLSGDIDGDGTAANNAFTVIFTDRVSEATWVDGFIISHANADDLTTIYGTRGNSGGGWFNDGIFEPLGSNPIIRNCTFEYNQVLGFGGAMYNEGSFSGQASPQLISCTIQYNSAEKGGGGIYNNGVFEGVSSPSLIACRLSNNFTVNSGAALYNNGLEGVSNPQITNCFFYENEATTYGAGMYNLGKTGSASPMIINCNFCSNKATAAGAIYNLGSESGNSSPEVINCTFYDNEAEVGACIYNQAGDPTGNCSPKVSNSIFWGNIAPFGLIFQNGYGTPHINHCLVEVADCDALNSGLNGNVSCGDGMIFNQDPMFMEPASNNLHLQSLSPAIDLGSNDVIRSTGVEVDLDSLDRFHNAVVDLGAYEYHTDQYIAPAVAQSPMSLNICEGERAQLEVLASGTGPLSYQWQKDAVDIPGEQDSLLVITSSSPADMGQYRCLIIGARMDTIISQSASLMVQPLLTPELLIQTTATEICSGETLTFTAQATHPGMNPQYQWLLNNQLINGANGLTYTSSSLAEGDLIQCQVISSESCLTSNMAQSNGLSPTVLPILNPSISISASSLEICEGETIDFSSIVVEAGMDAIYEWQINGQAIGDTDNFSTSVLNDGDVVRCRLQSLDPCATTAELFSNELSIIVQPLLSPTISISASSLEICEGETIDFSSVVATAGLDAIYEWQVNGQAIGNTNNFSTSVLNDGDVVRCRLQSLDPCATTTELFSNELSITVQPILSPTISISASSLEICEGEAIDFSSIVAEAGLGAVYEWQINGQAIGNTDNFSTSILNDGDVVRCRLQSLDPCAATTELFSNELSITVQPILSPTISI
ncbi:MAG: choice-of-anchor Q domain-containing protein, partial [Bacteroidota bacterium]